MLKTDVLAREIDAAGSETERAQRREAAKHTAAVCPKCMVQFAVCGCKPAAGGKKETK